MALDAFRAPEYLCAVPGAETKVTSTLSTGESYGNIFEQSTSPLRTMTESKSVMFRYGRFGRQASQRICRGIGGKSDTESSQSLGNAVRGNLKYRRNTEGFTQNR